jgi:hypothetical protein
MISLLGDPLTCLDLSRMDLGLLLSQINRKGPICFMLDLGEPMKDRMNNLLMLFGQVDLIMFKRS